MKNPTDNPCVVSQELINLECLQCGMITTGNFVTIVECLRCGAMDYHIFKSHAPLVAVTGSHTPRAPDNKDVVKRMIELVQRKAL